MSFSLVDSAQIRMARCDLRAKKLEEIAPVVFEEASPPMNFFNQLAVKPFSMLRRLTHHPPGPLETAIQFSVHNDIPGDYLEFGVYNGNSFTRAYRYHRNFLSGYLTRNRLENSAAVRRRFLPSTRSRVYPQWNSLSCHFTGAALTPCAARKRTSSSTSRAQA